MNGRYAMLILIMFFASLLFGCSAIDKQEGTQTPEVINMTGMSITSPEFANNSMIPTRFTCTGEDISPALEISGVSNRTKSLVLIMDDPDAPMGTWVHWVVFNIDPKTTIINEDSVPRGAIVGMNNWPKNSYNGPCPPLGTHRYFFKLYALDASLDLGSNARKPDIEDAMKGHIIATAQLIGLYKQ